MADRDTSSPRYDAIVIGASAGGVEALAELLPRLPVDLRASVVVVLHLRRERPSLLSEVFAPRCALPVREVQDKDRLRPGTIYFAPPDYHVLFDRGPQLALSTEALVQYSRPSIDVTFESAAQLLRERLLAIVLTGANEDGAQGMRAVHECGGTTIVQSPQTASASLMPASALKHSPADFVLPIEAIATLLLSFHREERL
ncbi:MAG TPA: chemotaxis protein CheB [Dokdonella sp.]